QHGYLRQLRGHGQGLRRLWRAGDRAGRHRARHPARGEEDRGRHSRAPRVHHGEGDRVLDLQVLSPVVSVKIDLGFMAQDLHDTPAYAGRAGDLGVAALWSADPKHAPSLPLAVAGANTTRVQLGTAIAVAFPRSPMIMAHTAWDLQKVSGGRF